MPYHNDLPVVILATLNSPQSDLPEPMFISAATSAASKFVAAANELSAVHMAFRVYGRFDAVVVATSAVAVQKVSQLPGVATVEVFEQRPSEHQHWPRES